MPNILKPNSPYLFDSDSGKIVGIKNADGSETLFAAQAPAPGLAPTYEPAFSSPIVPFGTEGINEFNCNGSGPNTLAVDTAVTFAGQPTTRVTVGGAPVGTGFEAGVSSAAVDLTPAQSAQLTAGTLPHLVAAVKGNFNANGAVLFIGNNTYSALVTATSNQKTTTADGWQVFQFDLRSNPLVVEGSAPSFAAPVRVKAAFSTGGVVPTGDIWFGFAGAHQGTKPTVVLTFDDGYSEWATYLAPLLRRLGLPAAFGIDVDYVGLNGFLTSAQIANLVADPTFDVYNHAANNEAFITVGLAKYMSNVHRCDAFLRQLGAPEASRKLHAYVQGSFDQSLINAMRSDGFTSAREVGAPGRSQYPLFNRMTPAVATSEQSLFTVPSTINLGNATTVNTAISRIEGLKAAGKTGFVLGHEFKAAIGPQTWLASGDPTYGATRFFRYLAEERDAGRIRVVKWSDYVTGLGTASV